MRISRIVFFAVLILVTTMTAMCQDKSGTKKVSFEYFYTVPSDMGIDRAKVVAAEEARVEALAREYGRTVSRSSVSVTKKEGDDEEESFLSISGNNVKGEWIADLKDPVYSFSGNEKTGEMGIVVKVTGLVRESASQSIPLDFKVLCNGTEDRFEAYEFRSGDWFFVSLVSPVDGYVSVFLKDNTENVVCMLPYARQSVGAMPVKAGEKQVFFSYEDAPLKQKNYVVQYSMTCQGAEEMDVLYMVFSTDPYSKPAMVDGTVPYMDFNRWLADIYGQNGTVKIVRKVILVKEKN